MMIGKGIYIFIATLVAFQLIIALYYPGVESKRGGKKSKGGRGHGPPQTKGGRPPPHGAGGRGRGPHGKKNDPFKTDPGRGNNKNEYYNFDKHPRGGPRSRGQNPYFTAFFHNPYFHMITRDEDLEWSKESGWHSADDDDEYHSSDKVTSEAPDTSEPPTTDGEQTITTWRGEGSFTGDLRLSCLETTPRKNCAYGVVEMFHKERDSWGTICGDCWKTGSAKVVCKYLNYRTGKALRLGPQKFPAELKYAPKYLRKLQCQGEEWTLTDCQGDPVKQNYTCKKDKLAGVKCSGYLGPEEEEPTDVQCGMSEMKCEVGDRCIAPTYVCDGMSDCPWGSDEQNCNDGNCNEDQYWCGPSGGGCISNEFLCDGEEDCIDGGDERECEQFLEAFTKTAGTKLRTKRSEIEWTNMCAYLCAQKCKEEAEFVCTSFDFHKKSRICLLYSPLSTRELKKSRKWDHYETEDREDCSADVKYRCNNGACVTYSQVCDSTEDCPSGEDESECKKGAK